MKSNSVHSQHFEKSEKKYNSLTDSLNYFSIYNSQLEPIEPKLNFICIYTLIEDTGEDIFKQILYYGTWETFQFELKQDRKRSDVLNPEIFSATVQTAAAVGESDEADKATSNNNEDGVPIKPRHGVPIEIQERQIGLAQAIVNFSKTFSNTDISDNVHSQKNRLIILEPEPKYFIVLNLSLGQRLRSSNTNKNTTVIDYLDYDLDDNLLRLWLQKAYESFALGYGDWSNLFKELGKEAFTQQLEMFYDRYFYLNNKFNNLTLLKTLNRLELLYLSKSNYLMCKQLFNQLETLNQHIQTSFIIFKGKLIMNDFFNTNAKEPIIQYYSQLFFDDFLNEEYINSDHGNRQGGGNRQSVFQSWNPFKRYSTASSSSSIYSPSFQFLNLWDASQVGDNDESQYFKPRYLTSYDPKSPLSIQLQNQLISDTPSIAKKFHYPDRTHKLAAIYSFAPHSYLVMTYTSESSLYLTTNYFDDLERLLQPILNDTLVQQLQLDFENYSKLRRELEFKKLEFFYWNLLNDIKEINFSDLHNNSDFKLVLEVIEELKGKSSNTQEMIVRTITKKRSLTNWICGKRSNESILILIIQKDSIIGEVEEEFRKLQNCYFNHLFLD